MINISEKSIFSFLIFLFAIVLLINTGGLRSDVASVPLFIGIALAILSGIQMLNDLFPSLRKFFPSINRHTSDQLGGIEGSADENKETKEEKRSRGFFIGWMVLFVLLVYLLNMIAAIAISLVIYLRFISKESWKMSLLYSVIYSAAVYLLFVLALDIYYFI